MLDTDVVNFVSLKESALKTGCFLLIEKRSDKQPDWQ